MFFFGNLATGHLSENFSPYVPSPGYAGSNDTSLMSVWLPGAESIAGQTDKQNKDIIDVTYNLSCY
jgi:hypothetical protein